MFVLTISVQCNKARSGEGGGGWQKAELAENSQIEEGSAQLSLLTNDMRTKAVIHGFSKRMIKSHK